MDQAEIERQVFPGAFEKLLTVFGRSKRQAAIVKGIETNAERERYNKLDTMESRLSRAFLGFTDLQYDRLAKYRDFDRMDVQSTECQVALDIYSEEAAQKDAKTGYRMWVESEDDKISGELNGMLQRIRWEAKAQGIYRNLAKYGDVFLYLNLGPYGIHDTQFIHPSRVERIQDDGLLGYKAPQLADLLPMDNRLGRFKPWDFAHLRLIAFDQETVYGRCYDEKTEVLTNRGWILFSELTLKDEVATRNMATKEFEWQAPQEITAKPYTGTMLHLKSKSVDLFVTPNHRVLLDRLPKASNNGKRRHPTEGGGEVVVEAHTLLDVTTRDSGARIPMTSRWRGKKIGKILFKSTEAEEILITRIFNNFGRTGGQAGTTQTFMRPCPVPFPMEISGDDYCALMGAYISEGNVRSDGGIEINQQPASKGYGPFGQLLARIGGGPAQHNGKAFVLPRRVLTEHFQQFGRAHEKHVPEEIMGATPEQLRLFWDYYILGDGCIFQHKNKRTKDRSAVSMTTVSRKLAGQLMEIAQKLGFSVSMSTKPARRQRILGRDHEAQLRETYILNVRYAKAYGFNVKPAPYKGMIYCVSVPNGIVYVRRNGKPAWCGNSMLDSLRKTWKQYNMLETMVVIYRIAKAVQRNVFYLDVGQASQAEAAGLVKQYEQFLKNKTQFIDPVTKEFRLDFNPATILQDIVWPVRSGSPTKVETLKNDSQMGPLEDLEHYRNKMRVGLGIPKDYFDGEYSGAWNSRDALALQDIRFGKKIQRLQDAVREGAIRICQIHWAIMHDEYLQPSQIQIQFGTISDQAERMREDVLLRKAQVLEILASIAITLGFNRRVWMDYLFDEIYPLPAELREKLMTPDPIDLANFEQDKELGKAVQAKVSKPRPRATADNISKGFRTFGYGEHAVVLDPKMAEKFLTETISEPEFALLRSQVSEVKKTPTMLREKNFKWSSFRELALVPDTLQKDQSYEEGGEGIPPFEKMAWVGLTEEELK